MGKIDEQFWQFHRENPKVYEYLKQLSLELRMRGVQSYSINSLFEVLRWKKALATDNDDFKLNNNFRSRYARLLMKEEPELEGFFEVRSLQTESALA